VDFVDKQLASRPEELPRLSRILDDGVVWHVAATVLLDGYEHKICLGFAHPTANVVRIGITGNDRQTVFPLCKADISQLRLIARAQTPGKQPGISLAFMLSYAKFLEEKLLRMHRVCVRYGLKEMCFYEQTYQRVFGGETPSMAPQLVLSICAATIASEAFFMTHAFGGPDNMTELLVATSETFHTLDGLTGELSEGARQFVFDLETLDRLRVSDWSSERYEHQRHITVYVLALLRMAEDLRAEARVVASA